MPALVLKEEHIVPGESLHASGHVVHPNAIYTPPDNHRPSYRIFYKKNKYGRPELSRLEVLFGQLARLFLLGNLTPPNNLIADSQNNILGLAVEHLGYIIKKKEKGSNKFHQFNDINKSCHTTPIVTDNPTEIPFYFMDKAPQSFFAQLSDEERDGHLTIDYESLASVLATSYSLEEDDLHKGNYGFYLADRGGKPHVVFFKIDHDLMFVDSIMGFLTRRPFHWFHGSHAFDIVSDDLESLATLTHSANSYWPTKFAYISKPFDRKENHNFADIQAFSRLTNHPEFIKGKWKSFLKHILVPKEMISKTLEDSVDMNNASNRAEVALLAQSTTARLARLRAVLFSIGEFRNYFYELPESDKQALFDEIIPPHMKDDKLLQQLNASWDQYKTLIQDPEGFDNGDTPLHVAIRLGEYRYEETLSMFREFIHVKNDEGKTPLDLALELIEKGESDENDVQKNGRLIAQHLLRNKAYATGNYERSKLLAEIKAYQFKNPYLDRIVENIGYQDFKDILRDIGEDHRFCLKAKKNLALDCIEKFIEVNEHNPLFKNHLVKLKKDINGTSSEEQSAGVKYIRQLRSSLWIIRQIRGLYGLSSTLGEINSMINLALESNKSKEPGTFSFFYCAQKTEKPFHQGLQLTSSI
ncbi:substrate of the Dot/Icm secretion system [Legionella wadsworthii]|uniref:Substrate of the Dot/Icm secretion system n=1 Tax=Legionella wadsworthii TaxID=28088 RepID=A0A378LRF5_9GAMM|nr:Dot/Icm T4SS effector AnkK/LegA5 [Legionella wadsworthii]STY28399.1 substrate of the Dot/Icm secretion system [Legionella wadsworthii]